MVYDAMDLPAARIQGPSRSRAARAAVIVASACVLFAAVAVVLKRGASGQEHGMELMWGGPLSFDMVHTHILNMKMRRSRLKEKLKEQALKRKDQEMAKEHGFNLKGRRRRSRWRSSRCSTRSRNTPSRNTPSRR
ncbi:hypothetical protein T484DRAFT_1912389 [Baffinella frigidus]|nr:hypothetical protein T484DRAFT_1912389 [Cryptophyta sp. CCMP2293]